MKNLWFAVWMLGMTWTGAFAQSFSFSELENESHWVDSVMRNLSATEKFAQLMIIRVPTPEDREGQEQLREKIKSLQPGGVTFFKGNPIAQVQNTNKIQSDSKIPMIISIDGEWGLAMRLSNTINYPYQMALGAIQDNDLIFEMGQDIAEQCKRMGIHLNFAPVVDINNNPDNPVINYRSFGENKWNVAKKGLAYAQGMENGGILTSIKHFPGHGDTDTDSHYALPVLDFSRERLDSLELFPFKYIIENGVGGVMVGHLNIPALEKDKTRASSLSKPIVSDLLKNKLGFDGIVMTDALEMKGIANHYGPGRASVESFKAGNDLLLLPGDPKEALYELNKALDKKEISLEELNRRVEKILRLKFRLNLDKPQKVELDGLIEDLNSRKYKLLKRQLVEKSLTVLENKEDILPVMNLDKMKVASISLGNTERTIFQSVLEKYSDIEHFNVSKESVDLSSVENNLDQFDLVIVGLHDDQLRPRNNRYYSDEIYQFIERLIEKKKVIITSFRNAYTVGNIKNIKSASGLIACYGDDEDVEDLAAQLIFGGIGATGKLPVSIGEFYKSGDGLVVTGGIRFKYTLPEELGIDSELLENKIDSVMQIGLDSAAFPGGEVFLAKDQKVFFHKTYGYHTYDKQIQVKKEDLYDFASVTKITGPLPALMILHDQEKFDLDATLSDYVPSMKRSNKGDLDWRNILAHNARLKSWIPYWTTTTRKNGKYKSRTLSVTLSGDYDFQLSDNLYQHKDYESKIYKMIRKSPLNDNPGYVYSGLSFYLYPGIIRDLSGRNYELFLKEEVYKKLGANTLTFNPMNHFELSRIVPTEMDTFFRKKLLHGVVHDEGAAMMKGVSGNAGLFGSANDLAKLMQMYLNMGEYGGVRYISYPTMKKFTSCQFCEEDNHRGLGFDKTQPYHPERQTAAASASRDSFGHSGYTGTFTWADPQNGLLFVFFSNRVHPTRLNTKLYQLNIRPAIHQIVYKLLE